MAEILTTAELEDIERFQEQRRRQPVPEDAWLYVAEIDRLIASHRALAADRDGRNNTQAQTVAEYEGDVASLTEQRDVAREREEESTREFKR